MSNPTERETWKTEAARIAGENCHLFYKFAEVLDDVPPLVSAVPLAKDAAQGPQLLRTLFLPGERACVNTSVSDFIIEDAHRIKITKRELKGGGYFRVNKVTAVKPSGRKGGVTDADSATEFMLIEMDRASRASQLAFWTAAISAGMPVISLTDSGGKSFHAILRIAAPDSAAYKDATARILDLLEPFIPDSSSRNCSRLTRLPGMLRGEGDEQRAQEMLYLNPSAPAWSWDAPVVALLDTFRAEALPVPEKVKSALRKAQERRERVPGDADDAGDKDFKKRLERTLQRRTIDMLEFAKGAGWHLFSAGSVEGLEEKHFITCPFSEDHTGGGSDDTQTDAYLFERTTTARFKWGFHCSHHSCADRRIIDVLELAKEESPELFSDALSPIVDVTALFEGIEPMEPDAPVETVVLEPVPVTLLASQPSITADERIFRHVHGKNVKCIVKDSVWMVWTGSRWEEVPLATVCNFALAARDARRKQILDDQPDEGEKMIAAAEKMGEPRNLEAIVKLAEIGRWPEVRREQFDRDNMLLGCPNGTLDLRTGELRPARREDLITKQAGIRFVPGATAARFHEALCQMFPDDRDVPAFLKRWFGYCLTGDNSHAVLPIFYGPNGRNGKSLLLRIMTKIAGEYAGTAPRGFLEEPRGSANPDAASSSTMHLKDKRLITVNELPAEAFLDEAIAKHITGGDELSGRPPYGRTTITFRPKAKMVLVTNHKPKIRGVDPATWDRVKLVTFNTSFLSKEDGRDLDLEAKLMLEIEGIFAWAVEGAVEWWNGGDKDLKIPLVVENDSANYRGDEDPLNAFIDQCCVSFLTPPDGPRDPLWHGQANKAKVSRAALYGAYATWARENNFKPIWSSKKFKQRMEAAGYDGSIVEGTRFWKNIDLKDLDFDGADR